MTSVDGGTQLLTSKTWPLGAGFLAGAVYTIWPLGLLVNPGFDFPDGYLSELSAADQPFSWLFRTGDGLVGVLTVVLGVALMRLPGRWWRVVAVSAVVFGVATVCDSLAPLDCAVSTDATCAAREAAGQVSLSHWIHTVTSVLANAAAVTGILATAVAVRTFVSPAAAGSSPLVSAGLARILVALAVTESGATILTLVFVGLGGPGLGISQSVAVLGISVWLAALGWLCHER